MCSKSLELDAHVDSAVQFDVFVACCVKHTKPSTSCYLSQIYGASGGSATSAMMISSRTRLEAAAGAAPRVNSRMDFGSLPGAGCDATEGLRPKTCSAFKAACVTWRMEASHGLAERLRFLGSGASRCTRNVCELCGSTYRLHTRVIRSTSVVGSPSEGQFLVPKRSGEFIHVT